MTGDVRHEFPGAAVIKPKSIDERVIFRQPEQPRLFVSALWLVRHSADFDKAKAQRPERVCRASVLIKTRGETYRIVELKSESFECAERRNLVPRRDDSSHRLRVQNRGKTI